MTALDSLIKRLTGSLPLALDQFGSARWYFGHGPLSPC